MTQRSKIPIAKLEFVNDTLAEGIDNAGDKSELFLTKVAIYLGAHHASEDELQHAVKLSLNDLSS